MTQYRWERRAAKLEARKKRMPVHGKGIGEMYANAIRNRNPHLTNDSPYDIIDMLDEEELEEE